MASELAEKVLFSSSALKGHGFSRVVSCFENTSGFSRWGTVLMTKKDSC
jgi:hypothetical protein